jgi:dihydroxyacetone kinase
MRQVRLLAAAVLPGLCLLLFAMPSADAPAGERGLAGGVLAWITGADHARAAALEAEAARAEAAVAALAERLVAAEAEAARTGAALMRAQPEGT